MRRIDALGYRPDRHSAFTRELLAEAEDEELNQIVKETAKQLDTPIALVSLVMEHIQFFKAHYGLSEDLCQVRGTDRDVSFCQFAVNNEEVFEINDAKNDNRIPQTFVKDYGIQSYLGAPVRFKDVVVGSLCVLDTHPRIFTNQDRENLKNLAEMVNIRLYALTGKRISSRSSLVDKLTFPALEELKKTLYPIKSSMSPSYMALVEISTFLKTFELNLYNPHYSKEDQKIAVNKAKEALELCQNNLYNIEASLEDAQDSVIALEHIFYPTTTTLLSEIAISGRELARYNLGKSGGAFLPDLQFDPIISTPRSTGVSLVATTLSVLSAELQKNNLNEKIRLDSVDMGGAAGLTITSNKLSVDQLNKIVSELKEHSGTDLSVGISSSRHEINLSFSIVQVRS